MAYAYYEKIASINLTTGTVTVETLDTELAVWAPRSSMMKGIVVSASRKNADEVLASAENLKAANKDVMVNIRENGLTGGGLRALGTASLFPAVGGG